MIKKIIIEKSIRDHQQVKFITSQLNDLPIHIIDRYDSVFGKVKTPYLQKRKGMNLFLASKKGQLIKETPQAYGLSGDPHYYFIHAYNCIYECAYCYLQGYFHSPDIVLFVNHEEIIEQISEVVKANGHKKIWFHAGEFSDSLALSHLTNELEFYFSFFEKNPSAYLELRTKSNNIGPLLKQKPLANVITSFSLSPQQNVDYKAPNIEERISAMAQLQKQGFPLAIHFDPIIISNQTVEHYKSLINSLEEKINLKNIDYISLGVVRFPNSIYHQAKSNYPTSSMWQQEFIKGEDGNIRYPRPIRMNVLNQIKDLLLHKGIEEQTIYLCME